MISTEYLFLLFLVSIYVWRPNVKELKWIIPFFFLFFGMSRGLMVGTDHFGYKDGFMYFHGFDSKNWDRFHFEKGYLFLIALFKLFSHNYLLFASLTFILYIGGILLFMNYYKVNNSWQYFLFYTLGFYFFGYNTMRQTIGIALTLAFIDFLYKKKYVYFGILTLLIAFLMHKSGAILLLLIPIHYFSEKIKYIPKKTLYIVVILSFLSYYIGQKFIKGFFTDFVTLIGFDDDYNRYIEYESENMGNLLSGMYTLFALILIYLKSKSGDRFCFYVYIFSVILFNLGNMMNGRATRMSLGFMYFIIPLIPLMLTKEPTKYKWILKTITIVFCIVYFFRSYYFANCGLINPYYYAF